MENKKSRMKFTVRKKDLLEVLIPIQSIIPSRTTLPILQNLKLSAQAGELKLEATDMDISLSRTLHTSVETPGAILVPGRKLYEIVRELPDLPVRAEQTDFTLTLTCERCVFKLPGVNTEDYPQIPTPEYDTSSSPDSSKGVQVSSIRLRASSLLRAIDKVSFAISTDENKPTLSGILWQIFQDKMKMVATDGHRLALMSIGSKYFSKQSVQTADVSEHAPNKETPKESSTPHERAIIPQKVLRLLDLLLRPYREKSHFQIDVQFGESRIDFIFSLPQGGTDSQDPMNPGDSSAESRGSVYLSSRLISGLYPDYDSALPRNNDKIIKVRRENFMQAIRRVAIFSNPYTHLIKFSIDSEKIGLSASSPQGGEAYDEVECDYGGEKFDIGYNANYVLDVSKRIESEQIQIQLKSPVDPGIFLPTELEENEDILYLLAPMSLQS